MYERFQLLLDKRGISAYKVAQDTNIATATLSQWKNGQSTPKLEKMQRIANYFGVSLEWLLGTSDSTTHYDIAIHSESIHNEITNISSKNMEYLPIYIQNITDTLRSSSSILVNNKILDNATKELLILNLECVQKNIVKLFEMNQK